MIGSSTSVISTSVISTSVISTSVIRRMKKLMGAQSMDQWIGNENSIGGVLCHMLILSLILSVDQWFPTRGPRAKSGPPSLKMWPATLDKF